MASQSEMTGTIDGSPQDGGCHDNTNVDVAGTSSNAPGFRRSSRKRSAPSVFVPQQKRKIYKYWNHADKVALLGFLDRLNNREILHTRQNHRFPYTLIKKHLKSKSLADIKMMLSRLERRGAAAALLRMKQQSPLESWCQMADNLTVLTSDDSSRHLIRVCRVMALESIDNDNSNKVTRKKLAASVASPIPVSTTTSRNVSNTQESIPSTSESTLQASSTASSQPQDKGPDPDTRETSLVVPKTEPSTNKATSTGKAKKKSTRGATRNEDKTPNEEEMLPGPDFESIYKYIAGLMQGEQKEIGGLESLVVLDCLKSIEVHLKGRNNSEQKQFVQQHLVGLIQNLYLTIDNDVNGCYGDNAVKGQVKITTADLIGPGSGQSQASSDKPGQSEAGSLSTSGRGVAVDSNSAATVNQSEGPVISDGQSASDSGLPSQSHESSSRPSMQQAMSNESATPKADSKHFKVIGLGSLNPFNVPVKLLEIRKDRR